MKRVIWINVAIGFWLLIAAFTQHAGLMRGLKMANDLTSAMLLLACSLWYLESPRGAIVGSVMLGGWLILSPFLLTYDAMSDVYAGIAGIAVIVVALLAAQPAWRRTPITE